MKNTELFTFVWKTLNQLQALHWQTKSYAQHQAYGETYDKFAELTDEFVEIYQGKYGRIHAAQSMTVTVVDIDQAGNFVEETVNAIQDDVSSLLSDKDTDLLNLRDELLALFNKLQYLLSLD